jgi:putative membrane protein
MNLRAEKTSEINSTFQSNSLLLPFVNLNRLLVVTFKRFNCNYNKLSFIGIVSATLLASCQTPQNDSAKYAENQDEDNVAVITKEDEAFAVNFTTGGMEEIELGKLAEEKGELKEVREFGKHIAHHHAHINHELKRLSKRKYITLPDSLPPDSKSYKKEELEKLQGTVFDQTCMTAMVKSHKRVLAYVEKEDSDTKDPDIKAFTERTIPIIKGHLQMAETTDSIARAQKTVKN